MRKEDWFMVGLGIIVALLVVAAMIFGDHLADTNKQNSTETSSNAPDYGGYGFDLIKPRPIN